MTITTAYKKAAATLQSVGASLRRLSISCFTYDAAGHLIAVEFVAYYDADGRQKKTVISVE